MKITLPESTNLINTFLLVGMLATGVRYYDSIATKTDLDLLAIDLKIESKTEDLIRLKALQTSGPLKQYQLRELYTLEESIEALRLDKDEILDNE